MSSTTISATLRVLVGTALAAAALLAMDAVPAHAAVVTAAPAYPIANATPGPPPIPALPAAGDTSPPAEQIADPVTAAASCVPWYQQSTYGQQWPATSTWWEYRCSYENDYYSNPCTSGACDAFCWYCYWETQDWTDYFYWDGSAAIFYGEVYSDNVVWEGDLAPPSSTTGWWDVATAAWYALAPTLSVSTSGGGTGEVTSDPSGIACGTSCQAIFDPGSTVTLTATPDGSSVFTGWSGYCTGTGACQVTIDQSHSVQATFKLKTFPLTVATAGPGHGLVYINPGATGCVGCQEPYDFGTSVTLTASPDTSSVFAGWSGDCTGTGVCRVTMDQAHAVTASFAQRSVNLSVSRVGSGSGQVSSEPAGIACGTTCQATFDAGSIVTLTATPDPGSTFTGWSGDCTGTGACQVSLDQARSVTVTFAQETFNLAVSVQGSGSGEVVSNPTGIGCGDGCQDTFGAGSIVTLTATPVAGSIFTGWSGDCTGTGACQVAMNEVRSVTANFALNSGPRASFTVTCTALKCTFDGRGSADSDGIIAAYIWDLGDGSRGSGPTISHTYPRPGHYTAILTVTDNSAASTSTSSLVSPIRLAARGYKQIGLEKVQLAWSGQSGASFVVARNRISIARVHANTYTNNINRKGPGTYTYRVCEAPTRMCSNTATVTF
jgi:hypothetical protein